MKMPLLLSELVMKRLVVMSVTVCAGDEDACVTVWAGDEASVTDGGL